MVGGAWCVVVSQIKFEPSRLGGKLSQIKFEPSRLGGKLSQIKFEPSSILAGNFWGPSPGVHFTIATIDDMVEDDEEDFTLPPMADGGEGVDMECHEISLATFYDTYYESIRGYSEFASEPRKKSTNQYQYRPWTLHSPPDVQ